MILKCCGALQFQLLSESEAIVSITLHCHLCLIRYTMFGIEDCSKSTSAIHTINHTT